MISLSLKLAVSVAPRPITVSGFAYPNETLVAPEGTSYQWYIDDVANGTSRTLIPDVYDIGLIVRCVVDGVECVPVTVWHPNQISAVKHFWWAASGAYNFLGNNYTDETAAFTVTEPESKTLLRNGSLNGKAAYGNVGTPESTYCSWNSTLNRWELVVFSTIFGDGQNFTYTSTDNTTYPWQVTTWTGGYNGNVQVATRVATTVDTLATDGQAVAAWRDLISGNDATASGSNIAFFEETDLATSSLKFDATDFFVIPTSIRTVFNSQSNCYIFAGAKDTNTIGGDGTHGVVSINRTAALGINANTPKVALLTRIAVGDTEFGVIARSNNATNISATSPSNGNYNVLTNESLFSAGSLRLRVNGTQTASNSISTVVPDNTTNNSFIGAYLSTTATNFNGYMTAIILAADSAPISDTDRSRIERFIGLLDGLNVAYEGIGAPRVGSDNPANAAEPNATAWVLMDGPFGPSEGNFYGGQSWRKMAPIGYFPYGNETYVYGDETVRYETGVWLYINATLGEIARAYSTEPYPWLATTWNNGFSAAKITSTYIKTTNYPAVP